VAPVSLQEVGPRRRILVPQPRSRFLLVVCPNCGHKQAIFSHSTFPVVCLSCGHRLVETTGGKARVAGKIEAILD